MGLSDAIPVINLGIDKPSRLFFLVLAMAA